MKTLAFQDDITIYGRIGTGKIPDKFNIGCKIEKTTNLMFMLFFIVGSI